MLTRRLIQVWQPIWTSKYGEDAQAFDIPKSSETRVGLSWHVLYRQPTTASSSIAGRRLLLQVMSFLKFSRAFQPVVTRRFASTLAAQSARRPYRYLAWGTAIGVTAYLAFTPPKIYLDSPVQTPLIQNEDGQDTVGQRALKFIILTS